MSEAIGTFTHNVKEPGFWDRAGAPSEVPFAVQETAIEVLLQEEPHLASVLEGPAEFALLEAEETAVRTAEVDPFVEAFKPTADQWENVKEILLPHPDVLPLDVNLHPVYRPAILERDAEGRDGGGDWHVVETERTKG